jgi:hypothetical protein
MYNQIASLQPLANTSQAKPIDTSGTIALGTFTLCLPLILMIVIARRKQRQRLIQYHTKQLERSWKLQPASNQP